MENELTINNTKSTHPKKLKSISLALISLFLIISSCDIYNQEDYREIIVVEAYAVANNPLPEIHITTTSPVDVEYNRESVIVQNANVRVTLLDENGNDSDQFNYYFSLTNDSYITTSPHKVIPSATYRLDIDFNDRPEIIQAFTTIPDEIQILNDIPDEVVYQSTDQIEITVSAPKRTNFQNVFVFSTIAEDPTIENLTPFYRASFDNENIDLQEVVINSSGLINEGNFEINSDQTITLRFPWIGVAFYGDSKIVINNVDKNLADLVRSQQVQLGGSTLSPGEIPNLIYNIEGGIGVFGSLSADTARTSFTRP
tara:strand:+ start:3035 stop:3973 length:939 start_codon:yes stop_codon:yes gene_type:complete